MFYCYTATLALTNHIKLLIVSACVRLQPVNFIQLSLGLFLCYVIQPFIWQKKRVLSFLSTVTPYPFKIPEVKLLSCTAKAKGQNLPITLTEQLSHLQQDKQYSTILLASPQCYTELKPNPPFGHYGGFLIFTLWHRTYGGTCLETTKLKQPSWSSHPLSNGQVELSESNWESR